MSKIPLRYTDLVALIRTLGKVSTSTAERRIEQMLAEGQVTKNSENGLYYFNEVKVEATPARVSLAPVPEDLLACPVNKQAAQLFDFLLLRGASPNAAAAAVGNVYHTAAKGALSLS